MAGGAGGKAAELAYSLRELWEQAGSPTYAKVVRQGAGQRPAVELNPGVLSDWLNGRGVPADPRRFAFLVTWLGHEATRLDRTHVPMPVAAWERLRSEAERERRPAGRPHATRTAEPATEGGSFVGRPVREFTDPFALEVHRAIEGPEHARAGLPVLPVYVLRAHDRVLRAAVERAAGGESTMITLVAGSSTGKTRACWEALQGVPDGWRLWHPIAPGRPEAVLAELSAVGPRTVVWLNEAQFYLEPAGVGERVAAELRELLRDRARAPVLVLATLWPDPYWNSLTTTPAAGAPDPHAQARALLTGSTNVRVPETFTGTDLETLRATASEDPRLAHALASGTDRRVAQFLAGALALLKRLDLAPAHARAVLEAAMDARRLGHGPVLRQAFLEDAADAYLTDDESDALADDWFEQALAYTTERVHGAVAPLTRIRPRRRSRNPATGDGPTYRLADYLEQHARHTRAAHCPSTSFWTAAHDHAHTTDDTFNLAHAAKDRLRLRHAERLYARASDLGAPRTPAASAGSRNGTGAHGGSDGAARGAGNAISLLWLAELREQAGDHDAAERVCRAAVDAGNTRAFTRLGDLREHAGDDTGAERAYRMAVDAGNDDALARLVELLVRTGHHDTAFLARKATEAGDSDALALLADWRARAGRRADAERLYRHAADAGSTDALMRSAWMHERSGRQDDAERLYREAADAGVPGAPRRLVELRHQVGDGGGAERLARKAAVAGRPDVLARLAGMRERAGDHADAERLFREAADAGSADALAWLAEAAENAGDHDEGELWYNRAADAGSRHALTRMTWRRIRAGDDAGAERAARRAAGTGNTYPLKRLAELREHAGDHDGAERLCREAVDAGDPHALMRLADARDEAGQHGAARRMYRRAADAGSARASTSLALSLERAGDHDAAERVAREIADETGDLYILARLAQARMDKRDAAGAERLFRRAVDAGYTPALPLQARLREQTGDLDNAERLYREALDAGYAPALPILARLRERTGDLDGAERLYRAAVSAEPAHALGEVAELRSRAGDHIGAERAALEAADAGNTMPLARLAENAGDHARGRRWRAWLRYGLDADDPPPNDT
ncbi:tetratricopeptide repeat protein [Embleya sp. NPDC059237]|uniref:tetratricopeptide repeat protein n=1 Tax=Embleya sp. NPDC059237 TaxID=3346784 RepID=UPI0036CB95F5